MVKIQDVRDGELVRLAQDGDGDAFGKLVERYRTKMYWLARRAIKSEEDAGEHERLDRTFHKHSWQQRSPVLCLSCVDSLPKDDFAPKGRNPRTY